MCVCVAITDIRCLAPQRHCDTPALATVGSKQLLEASNACKKQKCACIRIAPPPHTPPKVSQTGPFLGRGDIVMIIAMTRGK